MSVSTAQFDFGFHDDGGFSIPATRKPSPKPDPSPPQNAKPFYHDYAVLSKGAYDPKSQESNTKALGYEIDKDLSSRYHTVYYHAGSGKAVVAYRGTVPYNGSDLYADATDIFGSSRKLFDSPRFRQADKLYKQAVAKYGRKNVEVTGHSLGGSQAMFIGKKYNAKGIAFEPGIGPLDAIERSTLGYKTKVKIVSTAYDPKIWKHNAFQNFEYAISSGTRLRGPEAHYYVHARGSGLHTIDNFV